jgi:beta propeller repeat protein
VSGNIVVWSDQRSGAGDIYGYDLNTHSEFPICTTPSYQVDVRISGTLVVWGDYRAGNYDVYGFDLSSSTEIPIATGSKTQCLPDAWGDYVVYQVGGPGPDADIYGYRRSTGEVFPIFTGIGADFNPAIFGNTVVWQRGTDSSANIYGFDLATMTSFPICTASGAQYSPRIWDGVVIWQNGTSGAYAYDLKSGATFDVDPYAGGIAPEIGGNLVVWDDLRNYATQGRDIYAAIIPEPATLSLLALGMGAIWLKRRRQ